MDKYTICLPSTLFNKQYAFGMDFGCSVIKVVHTTTEVDNLRFHFNKFSGSQAFEESMKLINNISAGSLDRDESVGLIGVGASQNMDKIKQSLDIKAHVMLEHDMEVKAFNFLARNVSSAEYLTSPSTQAIKAGYKQAKHLSSLWRAWSKGGQMELPQYMQSGAQEYNVPDTPPDTIQHPVLLAYSGSSPSYSKVSSDGTYLVCDLTPIGGKTFCGLGRYITDHTKSFDELHAMACSGDSSHIDQHLSHLLSGCQDAYDCSDTEASDFSAFAFGQAGDKSKDELKEADMLAALLSNVAGCTAREAYSWAIQYRIKDVYFHGGFSTYSQQIRDLISTEFLYRNYGHVTEHTCDHWFITCGSYLGALGILLHNLQVV